MGESGTAATQEVDLLAELAKEPQNYANFYKFAALEITLSMWLIFYLFFSAKLLGLMVSFFANWFVLKKPQELHVRAVHLALCYARRLSADCIAARNGVCQGRHVFKRGWDNPSSRRGVTMTCLVRAVFPDFNFDTNSAPQILIFRWWRDWGKGSRDLLQVRVAGLEHCVVNNSKRYKELEKLTKTSRERRERPPVEQTASLGLEYPPMPPALFWISRSVHVDVHVGAILVGNSAMKTMLATSFTRAEGQIFLEDRNEHTSRAVTDLTVQEVSMKLKENRQCSEGDGDLSTRGALKIFGGFILSAITSPFRALAGQQDDDEIPADEVFSSPLVKLHRYQDVAGYIRTPDAGGHIEVQPDDEVCESGMAVEIANGKMTYGPWEERQRLLLHQCYSPEDYQDKQLTNLLPGWVAQETGFRLVVRWRGTASMRVPFSEQSGTRSAGFRDYTSGVERNTACDGHITIMAGQDRAASASRAAGQRAASVLAAQEGGLSGAAHDSVHGPRSDEDDRRSHESRSRNESESEDGGSCSSTWSADEDSEYHPEDSDDESQVEEGPGRTLLRQGLDSIPLVGELTAFVPLWALREPIESKFALRLLEGVTVSTCIPSEATNSVVWKSSSVDVKVLVRKGLKYVSTRETDIDVTCSNTTVRLLRDHTLLLSSLLADSSWRPRTKKRESERHFFVPTANKVKFTLKDQYRLGLIVNEENVVDDFGDDRMNNVLWIRGQTASAAATSLPTVFKEHQTRQLLTVEMPHVSVDLHPRLTDDVFGSMPNCIQVDSLRITGDNTTSNRSQLAGPVRVMNACITAAGVNGVSHGMVMRALRNVITNYVGDCSISVTSKDFQTTRCDETCTTGWNFRKKMHSFRVAGSRGAFDDDRDKTFHLDKSFRIALTDVNIELPEHLAVTVKRSQCPTAQIREVLMELRSTKAFSDLVINFAPITVEFPSKPAPSPQPKVADAAAQGVLVVDGLDFYQHSYHGPEPLRETYRSFTKLLPGRISGEIAPSQLFSLSLWAAQLWKAQTDWAAATSGDRKLGTPGKLWRRARAWQTIEAELGGVSLVVPAPGCIGHLEAAGGSLKSENLINSEYHASTTIKAPGIQASLNLASVDPLSGAGLEMHGLNAHDVPVGLEVARVRSSLSVTVRTKYSGWEIDAVKQYKFLLEKDVTNRLGLELAEYQLVAGMDESTSDEEDDNAAVGPEPDLDLSEHQYPTSLSMSQTDSQEFQSIGSDAELHTHTSIAEEADFVTADEQSSGMGEDFLSFDDSISLPSPPPTPDLTNTAFPFISHQMLQRVLTPAGSKLVPLMAFSRRGPCALDGLRILPANWAPKTAPSRPSTPTRKKRYGWNVPRASRAPHGGATKMAVRTVEVDTQALVVQICPLAVDVLSAMAETVTHLTSTVEGCMDAIRDRQYRAPVSLAFQGPHQLVTSFTVRASQIELQLLQPPPRSLAFHGGPNTPPSPGAASNTEDGARRPDSPLGSETSSDDASRSKAGRGGGMRLISVGVESFEVHVEERREAKDWNRDKGLRGLQGRYVAPRQSSAAQRSTVQPRDQSISLSIGKFCSWVCILPHGPNSTVEHAGLSKELIEEKCRGSSMLPAVASMHTVASVLAVVSGGNVKGRLVTCPPANVASPGSAGMRQQGPPNLYRMESDLPPQLPSRSCSIEADGVVLVCAPRCPEALGPSVQVWLQLGKQAQVQLATRRRVRLRNVELVLDQALPQIARRRGRSGSLGGANESVWGQNLPLLANLRRSKSEAPAGARAKGPGSSFGVPTMRRYGSENASRMKQRVTLSQVVSFLRCCSKKDLLELDSCLRTPATCEFVSHRTMNNVVSGSQYGSENAGEGWSLEMVATVRGMRLTVESSLASEPLSEISSNYSNLAVVCTREVSKIGAILASGPEITIVGQMWCGKWILKIFPSLVGFSSEVATYFGSHGREQAMAMVQQQRASWPQHEAARFSGKAKGVRSVSFAPAEFEREPQVQEVSTVVPLQGVLKRVTLPHKQQNQQSADLNRQYLASLELHDPLIWRGSGKRPRPRSLNSMAMVAALQESLFDLPSAPTPKDTDLFNGETAEFGNNTELRAPISIHLQASMDAAINATVPAEGQMRFRIKGCTVSLTQVLVPQQQLVPAETAFTIFKWSDGPTQTMQTLSFSIDSCAVQVLPMYLLSEDGAAHDHPQMRASNLSLSMIRSHCPAKETTDVSDSPVASLERNRSDMSSAKVKEVVQQKNHLYKGVVLDVESVVVEASLHKLEADSLHSLLVPWMARARRTRRHHSPTEPRRSSVTSGSDASSSPVSPLGELLPQVISVTISIQQSKADLRVLHNVKVVWKSQRGFYATSNHYSRPADEKNRFTGKALAQTEYCFRLRESVVETTKDGPPDDVTQVMQIPELRATGKMKTRSEEEMPVVQPQHIPSLARESEVRGSAKNLFAQDYSSVSAASNSSQHGSGEMSAEWRTPRSVGRSLTDVSVVFYIREMTADVGESMLETMLDIQRAMGNEITMLLQDAERNASSIKQKYQKRSAKGVQFHFLTTFMLEGIRLRAQAPNAALLLDSGSVVMQVEGRPKGSVPRRAQELHWKISLEGLSIAATSPHQRPFMTNMPPRPPATPTAANPSPSPSGAGGPEHTQWILAHLRNNTEMMNTAAEETRARLDLSDESAATSSSAPTTFRLLLTKTEFVAHPGSIQCFDILYTHYEQLLAKYKNGRKQIETGQMDQVLNRVLQTTKKALRGRIEQQAPTLMGNLLIQVVIQDTRASLLFVPEMSDSYSFSHGMNSHLAEVLVGASIRNPAFRKAQSVYDSHKAKDTHGHTDITLERGLHASLSRIGLKVQSWSTTHVALDGTVKSPRWRLKSDLDFQGLSAGFSPGSGRRSQTSPGDKTARWRLDADSDEGRHGLTNLRFEQAKAVLHVVQEERHHASLEVTLPSFHFGLDSSSVECALSFHDMWFRGYYLDVARGKTPNADRAESGGSLYESPMAGSFHSLDTSGGVTSPVSAKPRLVALEITLTSTEGTFRLYPNSIDERSAMEGANRGVSRSDRSTVLLEVPFPVFTVRATAVFLFSWKGFRDSQIRWVDNGRAATAGSGRVTSSRVEVDGQGFDLDVSLVCCEFEIPAASAWDAPNAESFTTSGRRASAYLGNRRPALSLSPAVLDFVRDAVDIFHQHSVRVHTRGVNTTLNTPTHSQSAKGILQSNAATSSFFTPDSVTPTTPKSFMARRTQSITPLAIVSEKSGSSSNNPLRRGPFFIINDIMYSMSYRSTLDLKLSGKSDAIGAENTVESGQHLALSTIDFDASCVVSSKQSVQMFRSVALSLKKLELRLVQELAQSTPQTQMSFVIEDLLVSFIAQRALKELPKNSFLCIIKSIKADVDVEAAVYKSKLLQDWTAGIGRIGDTSQWSYKDAALSAKLHESRKDEVLRGLLQVGEFRMNLETPVGRADLTAPHATGNNVSQRRRPAMIACGDLNLVAKGKEQDERRRQQLEDTFSVTLASCRLHQKVDHRSQMYNIGLEGDGNISRAYVYSFVSRQQTGGWQAYVQQLDLKLQTMEMHDRRVLLPFVDLHANKLMLSVHANKGISFGNNTVATISYDVLSVQASSETVKTSNQLRRQLEAMFAKEVDIGASPKIAFTAFTRHWSGDEDEDEGQAESVLMAPPQLTLAQRGREESVAPVTGNFGQLKIAGTKLTFTLLHDDVNMEKDAVLNVEVLQVDMERRQDNHDLRTNLIINLRKGVLAPAGKRRAQRRAFSAKPDVDLANTIFSVPQATIDIRTTQTVSQDGTMSPLVQCELETSFEDPIFATQNQDHYQFLALHVQHLRDARKATGAAIARTASYASALSCCTLRPKPDIQPLQDAARGMNGSVHGPLAQPLTTVDTRDYRCLLFKLEPAMLQLPDCSTNIGWVLYQLGVKKPESILAAVNTGVIDKLQAILVSVSALVRYAPSRRMAPRHRPSLFD